MIEVEKDNKKNWTKKNYLRFDFKKSMQLKIISFHRNYRYQRLHIHLGGFST